MTESEYGGPVVTRIVALAQPILDDLGLTLYDCEHAGGTLIITLDKRRDAGPGSDGPGSAAPRVLLDELSLFTRLLSRELDHDDPMPGRYTLEVSSPGLERRLRRPDHYAGAIGEAVAIRLVREIDGTRRLNGTLIGCHRQRHHDPARRRAPPAPTPAPSARSATRTSNGPRPSSPGAQPPSPARARPRAPGRLPLQRGPADAEEASIHHSQEAAAS